MTAVGWVEPGLSVSLGPGSLVSRTLNDYVRATWHRTRGHENVLDRRSSVRFGHMVPPPLPVALRAGVAVARGSVGHGHVGVESDVATAHVGAPWLYPPRMTLTLILLGVLGFAVVVCGGLDGV